MAKQKIARKRLPAPTRKNRQLKNMKRPKSFKEFLTTTMIGGFLVLLPITIFIFLVQFVFRLVARVIEPIAKFFSNVAMATFFADLLAFIIVVAFCFVVGLLVRTNFGNTIIKHFNTQYLSRLPFYNTIQEIVQQLFGKKENHGVQEN